MTVENMTSRLGNYFVLLINEAMIYSLTVVSAFTSVTSCNMQLSHYNFPSVACEKSASISLTLPNNTGFLVLLWFTSLVTLDQ
jgi:hypothetical protein